VVKPVKISIAQHTAILLHKWLFNFPSLQLATALANEALYFVFARPSLIINFAL
jgi:hypothetical protein